MKISDLKSAMQFVVENFKEQNIIQLFQQFNQVINQALVQKQNISISPQKDKLYEALRKINIDCLSYPERKIIEAYNGLKYLGDGLIKELEAILRDEKFDPVGVANKIASLFNETNKFFNIAQNLVNNLYPFKTKPEFEIEKGEGVLQLRFKDQTDIENIVHLKDEIETWLKIVRAFTILHNVPPEEVKILYLDKFNPTIMDFISPLPVILSLGLTVNQILNTIEKFLKLKRMFLEIERMKIENETLKLELNKEIENFKEISAEKIAKDIVEKATPKDKNKGEILSALKIAIKSLYDFLYKGGEIDYYLPYTVKKEPNEQEKYKEVESVYKKIRELEKEIKEIKALPGNTNRES